MKIVFLGDSLTYGYGVRRNSAWVTLLDELGGLEAINKGINGDTTGGMLARFKSDVIDLQPNMVHIMGGANDVICDATEDEMKPNMMAMIHQAQAYGIKVIVGIAPFKLGGNIPKAWYSFADFDKVAATMMKYREWLFRFSKAFGLDCIDYHQKFQEYAKGRDLASLFIDGLHLSEEGNKILFEIFKDYFFDNRQTQ